MNHHFKEIIMQKVKIVNGYVYSIEIKSLSNRFSFLPMLYLEQFYGDGFKFEIGWGTIVIRFTKILFRTPNDMLDYLTRALKLK